jgi:sporulation protein YlmC with PRC-barrel domain
MKTSLFLSAVAILGIPATSVIGQTQTSTATTTSGYVETSKIVGTKVRTAQGDEIGVVKDVVIDRGTGCMAYTVLSTGGTGTQVTQTKMVAVPWTVYTTTSEPGALVVNIDRDRIYNAPVFDYARINEYATSGYINNVYSYYGVSAQGGVSGQTAVTGGSTGRATETGGAATAPAAREGAAAAPAATAAETASPRPAATRSPRATHGKVREESPSSRARETETPASERRHRERMTSPGEETSETTASPSRERTRHRATEEQAEPSAPRRATREQPEPGATVPPEE